MLFELFWSFQNWYFFFVLGLIVMIPEFMYHVNYTRLLTRKISRGKSSKLCRCIADGLTERRYIKKNSRIFDFDDQSALTIMSTHANTLIGYALDWISWIRFFVSDGKLRFNKTKYCPLFSGVVRYTPTWFSECERTLTHAHEPSSSRRITNVRIPRVKAVNLEDLLLSLVVFLDATNHFSSNCAYHVGSYI